MVDLERDKTTQIDQILNLVKIASLSFPAIAFFQYYSNRFSNLFSLKHNILLIAVLLVILLIYIFRIYLQSKIKPDRTKKWIDAVMSLSIAFISVMLTGSYESSYKYLFIFIVISSSIEYSRQAAMAIAGISAAMLLGIDLIFVPRGPINGYFESDIVLACVFLIISWTIGYYVDLRKKYIDSLKELVNIDGLTGLYNHRYFHHCLSMQTERSKNLGTELSLLFLDIDNFKLYNDLFGHQQGDNVLKSISALIRENIERESIAARYGGEEFIVLLPGSGEEDAVDVAEKLREAVQKFEFDGEKNLPGGILTVSVGVATFPTNAKNEYELLKGADDACYRAKFLNKNRVEVYYSILDELKENADESDKEAVASIKTLIAVLNAKDKYMFRHVERVVFYCTSMADKLGLGEKEKKKLTHAAYLHDIGKINIPDDILCKSEALTPEEWEILTEHPQKAVDIVQSIRSLSDIAPIILHHHERYNGTGYPNNLKGDEIDYFARILAVADSFDAMTSARPYQDKKSYSQAISELRTCSGTQFDPEAVHLFLDTFSNIFMA